MRHVGCVWLVALCAPTAAGQVEPPLATSAQWEPWYQSVLAARLGACPRERSRTYHFSQDGSDERGDGSLEAPWRSLARARAVLDSAPDGDVALLFRRGDVWHETIGLLTIAPRITIADYGAGEKPVFSAFEPVGDPGGWSATPGLIATYQRGELPNVTWVKEDDDLDRPYSRQSSLRGVEANEGSFHYDARRGVLYIHPKHGPGGGATDPRVDGKPYELVRPRDSGVAVSGHGSRVENIRAIGWGVTGGPVTQRHGIESHAHGSSQVAFVGCESYYGNTHLMVHASPYGGIATFVDCRAGLTTYRPLWGGDGGTVFNAFAYDGGNQAIWDHCVATHGALPDDAHRGPAGMGFYGHTSGLPGAEAALIVSHGCVIRGSPLGCSAPSAFDHLRPAPTLEAVRCFIVDEVMEGGPGTGSGLAIGVTHAARVNGRYLNLRPPPLLSGALAASRAGGWAINCTVELDGRDQPIPFALYHTPWNQVSDVRLWHCAIDARTPPGLRFSLDLDEPTRSGPASMCNTVLAHRGGGVCRPNIGSAGTVIGNAYCGVEPAACALDPRAIIVGAPPRLSTAPSCGSGLCCAAAPLPGGVVLGFDQSGRACARDEVGPLETPWCGNCDGSGAPPVVNVNDFICFQNQWAAGDPNADCDGSGALNINDFMCFMSVFGSACP